jgi:hypothetical protein
MSSAVSAPNNVAKQQHYLFRSNFIFVLLFTFSFSTPTHYIPSLRNYTDPIFEQFVLWTGTFIFRFQEPFIYQLTSDSTGAFIHTFNLMILACFAAWIWGRIQPNFNYDKLSYAFYAYVRYYLALQLFLYGFNKIFKCQFFLPEPNTLYTRVGEVPKDLLFWSAMGSSYFYTVFGGVMEVLAGSLLLFRKTYLLGSLIAFGVLGNVLAINLGFNISVKLYASFFLFLSLTLIAPYLKSLYSFFIHQKFIKSELWFPAFSTKKRRLFYSLIKTISIWFLLFEALVPYFKVNNFNDDLQKRPLFHGAYAVTSFLKNEVPVPALTAFTKRWKRVFVHRRGYFIVQTMENKMQDYKFEYDLEAQQFYLEHSETLVEYQLKYTESATGDLQLRGNIEGQDIQVRLRQLDWRKSPLLKQEFNWTIDAIL